MNTIEMTEEQQEQRFWDGYDEGWSRAIEARGGQVGDPVGVDEYYDLGWWNGVGNYLAWEEGWRAAERGILFCPYLIGADDECFREHWMNGYQGKMKCMASSENPSYTGRLLA